MHISEGIITGIPAAVFTVVSLGLVGVGAKEMTKFAKEFPEKKPLLGMAGAFIFFLSLIPIPAFTGTTSHPCGAPMAAILLGPWIGIALTGLSLFLQAAFFAHGGFSTWGANVIILGVGGAMCGWAAFKISRKVGLSLVVSAAIGGFIGNILTYTFAGLTLASVLSTGPQPQYTFMQYLGVIYTAYLPTQGPIAIGELFMTGLIIKYVYEQRPEILESLKVVTVKVSIIFLVGFLLFLPIQTAVAQNMDNTVNNQQHQAAEPEGEETGMMGMDEAINESLAEKAGMPPRDPYINIEALGDVWNTIILLAGGICGFIIGRWWDLLFVGNQKCQKNSI
ncbi:MAG: energy-coupling factor ABC transporter permease [Bacteriovoracaceae bacterium]|nr:energy-coupling factor ABC transporter permease [Bacteriovoracaceae bacterium]